jgi:molecular chaperone GrpE
MSDEQDEQVNDVSQPEGAPAGTAGQNPAESIQELRAQNEELTNNWKRALADFENYKRRKEVEGRELIEYSNSMVVMRLIPSLQSLEQVLSFAPNDEKYKDWLLGLKATIMQLEKTMEELGVTKIKTAGQPFDPNLHEAVEETESETDGIVREVQPGFLLNGKLITPAKVVVGKKVNKGEEKS